MSWRDEFKTPTFDRWGKSFGSKFKGGKGGGLTRKALDRFKTKTHTGTIKDLSSEDREKYEDRQASLSYLSSRGSSETGYNIQAGEFASGRVEDFRLVEDDPDVYKRLSRLETGARQLYANSFFS